MANKNNWLKSFIISILDRFFPSRFYSKSAYSQDGEDLVLASFYEGRETYKGFFVDVGAHHPYRFSNTCLFYKRGWRGINIEPTPDLFKKFEIHRKRDINLNCGIGNGETLNFYIFNEGALNTFDEERAKELDGSKNGKYKLIATQGIKTRLLKDILDEHLPANQKIDLLTIDVEGMDFTVLQSNDWTKYQPEFIFIECAQTDNSIFEDEIYKFLVDKGYNIVGRTRRTTLFKKI